MAEGNTIYSPKTVHNNQDEFTVFEHLSFDWTPVDSLEIHLRRGLLFVWLEKLSVLKVEIAPSRYGWSI